MENISAKATKATIVSLPNEIIYFILINNDYREILRFSATCKRFNDLVNNDQSLWKIIFKKTVSNDVKKIIEEQTDADWLSEVKRYFVLQRNLHLELIQMSPQFYWRTSEVSLADMRSVYALALSHSLSYYYTIVTLQDTIVKTKYKLDLWISTKPYTLTGMYYAEVALRHIIHTFLCVKWVKHHIMNKLPPQFVVNFFVQWTDTNNLYPDENVTDKIQELFKKVEDFLEQNHPSTTESIHVRYSKGKIKEKKVLEAISQTIFHQMRMAVTQTANVENLNIVQVINYKCGHPIAVGAIYNAIAKQFGIDCDLIAFPNHLYLEWREHKGDITNLYTIDLTTGNIQPKLRCPFSQGNSSIKYSADSFLQYIYSKFHTTMGAIKNCYTHNAALLLDFFGNNDDARNPYRSFLPYLLDVTNLPAMSIDLNLKYLTPPHLQIINSLANLNAPCSTVCRSMIVKERCSTVKFAVGMICYHQKYDYVCVIRGWDARCTVEWQSRMETDCLELGPKQPFYYVVAADQSERYVAQENLLEVKQPNRLYHLEHFIGREFTRFDGFAYEPNDEKKNEYPGDHRIAQRYRAVCYKNYNPRWTDND